MQSFRRPESVLIVIYTAGGEFLLLERRKPPGFWQSVTGSLEWGETADAAARRELIEETGITQGHLRNLQWTQVYEILPSFGKKYAPGVTRNLEHAFALKLLQRVPVTLSEHVQYRWLSAAEAIDEGLLEHRPRRHPAAAPLGAAVRTVVVYVHGLWLNGWESLLLRQRLSRQLELHRAVVPLFLGRRGTGGECARARGVSRADCEADALHLVGHSMGGLVILELFESAPLRGALPRARRRCRRAASCCSALRFAAAAPPAISRSCLSAGASSVCTAHEALLPERDRQWRGGARARHHRRHRAGGLRPLHGTFRRAERRHGAGRGDASGRGEAALCPCARRTPAWCIRPKSRARRRPFCARGVSRTKSRGRRGAAAG